MKYFATIDDQTYEIIIEPSGRIIIDGHEMMAQMAKVGQLHLYSLLLDNASHEVQVEVDAKQRNGYDVLVEGARYAIKVQDERSRRLALADRRLRPGTGELAIKAPIPGLVVKVSVEPGEHVEEGQALVILEAMKMENELRAPRAGVIHEVRTEPGAQIAMGQILVTLREQT